MPNKYYKLTIPVTSEEEKETTIGMLHLLSDFESIQEEDTHIIVSYNASIQDQDELVQSIKESGFISDYEIEAIENKNWNEIYEKSFEPIRILNNKWGVRASFHHPLDVEKEIVIDPKMSFGTGHHETTKQMMELMDGENFIDKNVFDYGSGTGILAIMAKMKGAHAVKAIDNEEWAYNNSLENAVINSVESIQFHCGDISMSESDGFLNSTHDQFDIIIANITKNILIQSAAKINEYAKEKSLLFLSGFYESDVQDLLSIYEPYGYSLLKSSVEKNWTCLKLIKN